MADSKLEADCQKCEMEAGAGPQGGWVLQDENWSVGIADGMEVPGWLTGQIRRHAVGAAALNEAEQASLGPLLGRLTQAITEVTGAEKVYVVAFGEAFPHWHFLLMARTGEVDVAHRGAALILNKARYLDQGEALAAAARIRSVLARDD